MEAVQNTPAPTTPFSAWIAAARPKTLTAAWVPVFVASFLAHTQRGQLLPWVLVCALLSSLFIQIGTNLFNDAIDFKKGADTAARVGPVRVTASGLISPRRVYGAATVCLVFATAFGVPLMIQGGLPILAVGLVSLFLCYGYTGGPFPLAYLGLGDLFVILFFGLTAVGGTYFLHTGSLSTASLIAGLQAGLLATVLIAINNFRDWQGDQRVGKNTLAVRFGPRFARLEITFLNAAAFLLGAYWLGIGMWRVAVFPVIAAPLAVRVVRKIWTTEPGPEFNHLLGLSAAVHLIFGIGLCLGLALS